jgi:sarcosine/dimethylglycine N-methyltransferase
MRALDQHYSVRDIEERIGAAIRAAGLDADRGFTPDELAELDQFHTGGRRATLELLDLVPLGPHHRVLDVGAGLGGAARLIASARGCHVVCVERSRDHCAGARLLNRLTRLEDHVEVHEGGVLDLPFPASSFDVAWMQNVGMNVEDKRRLYVELRRVLKPGGRFALQEIAAGVGDPHFPLPWASAPTESFLVPVADLRSGVEESGFVAELFEDLTDAELSRASAAAAKGPLTLAAWIDNIGEKARNSRRSLHEGRVRLVRGVFRAV